jgi:hypothetical protein
LRGTYGNANKKTLEIFFMDAGCRVLFYRYCDMMNSYKPCKARGKMNEAKSEPGWQRDEITDDEKVQ